VVLACVRGGMPRAFDNGFIEVSFVAAFRMQTLLSLGAPSSDGVVLDTTPASSSVSPCGRCKTARCRIVPVAALRQI
jgi:hypothetical protein